MNSLGIPYRPFMDCAYLITFGTAELPLQSRTMYSLLVVCALC